MYDVQEIPSQVIVPEHSIGSMRKLDVYDHIGSFFFFMAITVVEAIFRVMKALEVNSYHITLVTT